MRGRPPSADEQGSEAPPEGTPKTGAAAVARQHPIGRLRRTLRQAHDDRDDLVATLRHRPHFVADESLREDRKIGQNVPDRFHVALSLAGLLHSSVSAASAMPGDRPMSPSPRCSVIIPTYNCLELLPLAVASVRMQGVDDIEILVVDDASTDGTPNGWRPKPPRDPRVIALHTERKGPSYTRNPALFQARAPIVAFLDADDLWWPNKLARGAHVPRSSARNRLQLHRLSCPSRPNGDVRGTCFDYLAAGLCRPADVRISRSCPTPNWSFLRPTSSAPRPSSLRADALQNANGFAMASRSAEDWDLWLRLAARGPVACSAASTATYLMRPTSVTQNKSARIQAMRDIIEPYRGRTDAPRAPGRGGGERADRYRRGGARPRPGRPLGRGAGSSARPLQTAPAPGRARRRRRYPCGLQRRKVTA